MTGADDETIRLRDGRRLGFAQFGDLTGSPIFFFHGGGDSRLQRHPDDSIAQSLGVRLITTDRPGVGLSDYKRRTLGSWADDVAELADRLGIGQFAVLGYSNGGPHALACAYRLADRLTVAGVACGIAPFDRPGALDDVSPFVRRLFTYARRSRWLVRVPIYLLERRARRDLGGLLDRLFETATEFDRAVYADPARRENQIAAMREAVRRGGRGLSWELAMLARPWDVCLEEISGKVLLWYGDADNTTPLSMGRYLATTIPGAELTVWPGAGHQGIWVHWREILAALMSHRSRPAAPVSR